MCEFLSAVVIKREDGIEFACLPEYTDSHDDLIKFAQLHETDVSERMYAKVEYTPKAEAYKIDEYEFCIDECRTPDWWTEDIQNEVIERLQSILKVALIERPFHLGGLHICNNYNCTVRTGRVIAWGNSTVKAWVNSTVEACGNSQVRAYNNSQVTAWGNSQATKCDCGSCNPTITRR